MEDWEYPRRDALISPPMARANVRAPKPNEAPEKISIQNPRHVVMFDPERPNVTADDLLKELGGKMTDPSAMNHNCPFCHKTLQWALFNVHLEPCLNRWRSLYRKQF